ncbi:MAG: hypothetical protein EBY52_02470, partial [Actinobacteria bacterium]|nr:hypothetical protein [Actinomycetota bacterium]
AACTDGTSVPHTNTTRVARSSASSEKSLIPPAVSKTTGRLVRSRSSTTANTSCVLSRSAEDELLEMFGEDEVKLALEDLPEHYRIPILLADVEGFAYKEIAEILDVPIGTVMSRLHRGRKQLQKRLYSFAEEHRLLPDPEPVS